MKPKTPLDKPPLANGNGASLGHQLPKEVARPEPPLKPSSPARKPVGEQPVILEQPALWSRVFVWLIIGVTASALIWAAVAKIEEAVPAAGKLEPQGSVKAIKAPTGGVVRQIHVKDGQRVKKGQLLLAFDPTAPEADQASLTKLRETLLKENQFYSTQLKGSSPGTGGVDWESLLRLRAALVAENQYYKAQVDGSRPQGVGEFNATQRNLLASSQAESQSRVAAAQLQIQELT
ncbi:MAG TPA: biotin/lipoyl-binding protein, partial [Candidatus Caenarcaniphilales bacterium]